MSVSVRLPASELLRANPSLQRRSQNFVAFTGADHDLKRLPGRCGNSSRLKGRRLNRAESGYIPSPLPNHAERRQHRQSSLRTSLPRIFPCFPQRLGNHSEEFFNSPGCQIARPLDPRPVRSVTLRGKGSNQKNTSDRIFDRVQHGIRSGPVHGEVPGALQNLAGVRSVCSDSDISTTQAGALRVPPCTKGNPVKAQQDCSYDNPTSFLDFFQETPRSEPCLRNVRRFPQPAYFGLVRAIHFTERTWLLEMFSQPSLSVLPNGPNRPSQSAKESAAPSITLTSTRLQLPRQGVYILNVIKHSGPGLSVGSLRVRSLKHQNG